MSGPIERPDWECDDEVLRAVEVKDGRRTTVGGLEIVRVLPTKGRRTVGAWCFVDLMGPEEVTEPDPMEVGPHPHIGLATVTWLLAGEAVHTDSLGTEQLIRPGQLNLMHAGNGIAHAELAAQPPFRGVQLWVAQPEATRHGTPGFEHHAELPQVTVSPTADATVLLGSFAGTSSSGRTDTDLVGAEVTLRPGSTDIPVDAAHEHAMVPLDRPVLVAGQVVEVGALALVPTGTELIPVEARDQGGRVLLLGGEPFESPVTMWWNFVARSQDEITAAWRDWQGHDEDRFAPVTSTLDRIDAPTPPWIRQG